MSGTSAWMMGFCVSARADGPAMCHAKTSTTKKRKCQCCAGDQSVNFSTGIRAVKAGCATAAVSELPHTVCISDIGGNILPVDRQRETGRGLNYIRSVRTTEKIKRH